MSISSFCLICYYHDDLINYQLEKKFKRIKQRNEQGPVLVHWKKTWIVKVRGRQEGDC